MVVQTIKGPNQRRSSFANGSLERVELNRHFFRLRSQSSPWRVWSYTMSSNRNKTTVCGICGKVTRDDKFKRHMDSKHPSAEKVVQEDEENQFHIKRDVKTVDVQHNGMLSLSGNDDEVPSHTACEEQCSGPLKSIPKLCALIFQSLAISFDLIARFYLLLHI